MRKQFFFDSTLYFLTASLLCQPITPCFASASSLMASNEDEKASYTMNFRNISLLEYVRFVSKITGLNFIYNESDLLFTVSILSEEPVTKKNLVSAMIQVLQINGLTVAEQNDSLVISKIAGAAQIAKIVTDATPLNEVSSPIITKIFRVKNINIATIAPILKSLSSKAAMIEVLVDSKQLIITDLATNIDRIEALVKELDNSDSPLQIVPYNTQYVDPETLSAMIVKIIAPFQEGNVFLTLPQAGSNLLLLVSTPYLIQKAQAALPSIDNAQASTYWIYNIQNVSPDIIEQALHETAISLEQSKAVDPDHLVDAIDNMQYNKSSNSFVFSGTAKAIEKLQKLLPTIDSPTSTDTLWIYNLQHVDVLTLKEVLSETANNIEKSNFSDNDRLLDAINNMQFVAATNSVIFSGTPKAIAQLKQIVPTLDTDERNKTLWIYQIKYQNPEVIQDSLMEIADNVEKNKTMDTVGLVDAIDSMEYNKATNSLIFNGSKGALDKIQYYLTGIDVASSPGNTFWIYHIQNLDPQTIQNALIDTAENIEKSKAPDPAHLVSAIDSMQYVAATNSLVFNGSPQAIAKLQEMLPSIDMNKKEKGTIFIYKPKFVSKQVLLNSMDEIVQSLNPKDPSSEELAECLRNAQWLNDTDSFVFKSDPATLSRVQAILQDIDTEASTSPTAGSTFHLYKLQYASGSQVENQLKAMAEKLPSDSPQAKEVIACLDSVKWIPENNSLLISGSPRTIDKVLPLIEKFDVAPGTTIGAKDNFFIYTPQLKTPQVIQAALNEYADTFEQSGLADPGLIAAITSAKIPPSGGQLIFTGNTESLEKIKELLTTIDSPQQAQLGIHQVGGLTFLVYPLQNVSAQQFMELMHNFEQNLQKNGALDESLQKAIDSMQWIKDTNSIMFVGPSDTLDKISSIASRIDVAGAAAAEQGLTYDVYSPKFVSGQDLIDQLCEFAQNLAESGVQDSGFYDTINNIKWIERSNMLIISGNPDGISRVKELLARFDVSNPQTEEAQRIAGAGFMVFKLQYHTGDMIQQALKKLSPSFAANGPNPNPPLAFAIDSIQWIQVTNSLVASGESDALERLKALISEIDIPLRQVFIEVLVIETDVTNTQSFGLQWGGNAQYLNKIALSTGNYTGQNPITQSTTFTPFSTTFNPVNATTTPVPTDMPVMNPGFDLGVIGDLIMHKGESFLSLGSLVNALQLDSDSTIIMNPKIITQDNNNSTIFVGQNVPYIGSTVAQSGQVLTNTSNLEYRNVGINLSITPTLGNDDVVTMDVNYTMSAIVENSQTSITTSPSGILTTQTNLTTKVHVPDQHFVVLSGMIQDSKAYYKTGIPCLGGLPIIGAVFSENDRSNAKSNVIIFIRPKIIHTFAEYKEITEGQEDLFRDQSAKRTVKEDYDLGLDLVKSPENE